MIDKKDWNGLNFQEIEANKELLEEYDGYIPLIFHKYISNIRRMDLIKEKDSYANIQKELYDKRIEFKKAENKSEWLISDVIDWVNKNPFFEVLVVQ